MRGAGEQGRSLVQHHRVRVPGCSLSWICWCSLGEPREHLMCALPAGAEQGDRAGTELSDPMGRAGSSCPGGLQDPQGFIWGSWCWGEADPAGKRHRSSALCCTEVQLDRGWAQITHTLTGKATRMCAVWHAGKYTRVRAWQKAHLNPQITKQEHRAASQHWHRWLL